MDPHKIRLNLQGYQSEHQADGNAQARKAYVRHKRYKY